MRRQPSAAGNIADLLQSPPLCVRLWVFAKPLAEILSLNHRRSDMKKFLTTLAVLTAFATPALAQSFDPDVGTGNALPFAYTPAARQDQKIAARQSGLHAFAMVPGPGATFNPNSPALTGGG